MSRSRRLPAPETRVVAGFPLLVLTPGSPAPLPTGLVRIAASSGSRNRVASRRRAI